MPAASDLRRATRTRHPTYPTGPRMSISRPLTMPPSVQRQPSFPRADRCPTQRPVTTSAHGGQAQFCYATNYLIDVQSGVIVDVEASTAVRQAEVTAAKRMITRVHDSLGIWPRKLIADTGYGSAEMLTWLVHERHIEPHIPVFDKSDRSDGTFSRSDFAYDTEADVYTCPAGKLLKRRQRRHHDRPDAVSADGIIKYRASKIDCDVCPLKPQCCPATDARKVPRSIHEGARDFARALCDEDEWLVSRCERKKVEMLFAHLKRILRLDRLRLRGPNGARDEFHLAAAAQNLRSSPRSSRCQPQHSLPDRQGFSAPHQSTIKAAADGDFFNRIGQSGPLTEATDVAIRFDPSGERRRLDLQWRDLWHGFRTIHYATPRYALPARCQGADGISKVADQPSKAVIARAD